MSRFKELEARDIYEGFFTHEVVDDTKKEDLYIPLMVEFTLQNIDDNIIERDDLAILCYICMATNNIHREMKYRHIFIDEAQDLSEAELKILSMLSENDSLTIMGDINQSLYYHRGFSDWNNMAGKVFGIATPEILNLCNSYRFTF